LTCRYYLKKTFYDKYVKDKGGDKASEQTAENGSKDGATDRSEIDKGLAKPPVIA
jgi:hypothetical protein